MAEAAVAGGGLDRRRWLLLWVIGLAQLMVVLDLTVMNIALPSAQRALHFSTVDRQWVLTAYTLSFGSLLLLGGRLADLLGRKVTFLAGLVGFAGVSAIGGASVNFPMLVFARLHWARTFWSLSRSRSMDLGTPTTWSSGVAMISPRSRPTRRPCSPRDS